MEPRSYGMEPRLPVTNGMTDGHLKGKARRKFLKKHAKAVEKYRDYHNSADQVREQQRKAHRGWFLKHKKGSVKEGLRNFIIESVELDELKLPKGGSKVAREVIKGSKSAFKWTRDPKFLKKSAKRQVLTKAQNVGAKGGDTFLKDIQKVPKHHTGKPEKWSKFKDGVSSLERVGKIR